MRAHLVFALSLLLTFSAAGTAHAQVHQAAVGSERHLWGGVEFSDFQNDYIRYIRSDGIGFYGDYMLTERVTAEAQVRLLDLNKPVGLTEKSFLVGPLVNVYQYHRATAYAKFLLGVGTFNFPPIGYGSYFAYGTGGGVDYRLSSRFKVRGEYEYDFLPSAPGEQLTYPNPSNGLTPNGFSVGVSYRIF